jgi:DNA polymerase-3 subunit chi
VTDIGFYHLERSPLERALPKLLEKVLDAGKRAVVMAGSEERVDALNAVLWTYEQGSFLPHGSAADGDAAEQPIWLTTTDENPNSAEILVLTDGAASQRMADYERCLEMFDGKDETAVAAARERWAAYREAGHDIAYWQQTERGWEQKAQSENDGAG